MRPLVSFTVDSVDPATLPHPVPGASFCTSRVSRRFPVHAGDRRLELGDGVGRGPQRRRGQQEGRLHRERARRVRRQHQGQRHV